MNVLEAIHARRSVRGFKSDPVPQPVLRHLLETAIRAPSGVNAQPWEITVVTGGPLDAIKRANIERLAAEAANDSGANGHRSLQGVYRQRQVALAIQLFKLMGIGRDDREKRREWIERGARYFEAPAVILLYGDESLEERRVWFDLGVLAANICLAALAHGLGTCIQGQGVAYPEVLRQHAGIPASKRIVTSIAIGYPDPDFPANHLYSQREPLDRITTWVGFQER